MKQIILLILTLALVATGCHNEKQDSNVTSLEVYADSLFQASIDSSQIAGAAILVFQKDTMLLNKSYGYASLELSTPMPSDGIFDIGSVTKQFTAAAILKLVEANKLSLDDDFTEYLPFDTKGRKVTIAQLLDHTSGMEADMGEEVEFFDMLTNQGLPHNAIVKMFKPKDFMFEPGEALIYNNNAYSYLGLIIEKVTGQSYEDYLKEIFFKPLGMNSTSFGSNIEVTKNKVNGYRYDSLGIQQKPYLNYNLPYSAGSLSSNTQDLLIWMKALHQGKILSAASYQSMITPRQLNDGSKLQYAKALVNYSDFGNDKIGHTGGFSGFMTDTRYYPEEDLYIICLVNTSGGPKNATFFADPITWQLLDKKMPENVDLDIETALLEGLYTGPTRGNYTDSIQVKSIVGGMIVQKLKSDKIDTLKTYIGNNTWADSNNRIVIKNNEYRDIQPYAYYILKKEK
ncbi:serine hydrolase domain-containing protein [Sediminicola arcticus]|uniref:Serine hydrolase domain-containing protein n=1 Tax=Sediminicola arcticus TaxID=1574308 RepID=A0ABV2SSZ2_9FLAO